MSEHAIETPLRRYILDELAATPQRHLERDAPLFESLLDSTSVLALVSFVETRFGIDIDDHEIVPSHFSTLRQLGEFVERKRAPPALPRGAAA